VALFGVRKASKGDSHEAGDGLTFVVDITKVVDALHLANNFDVSKLDVRLVPTRPVSDAAQISIGRIGVFREGE
jgi:tyrosinase